MQFDVIDTSYLDIGVMIGDVDGDGDGEGVGKGKSADDCRDFCVCSICLLILVSFNKSQGVCELLKGDTTTDKIELLFNIKKISVVPRHHWHFVVLPPCMFANVAPALCVLLEVLHSAPVCVQLPCLKQYFPTRDDWSLLALRPLPHSQPRPRPLLRPRPWYAPS